MLRACLLGGAALLGSGCGRPDAPAVIAYPDHMLGPGLGRVAQVAIDDLGPARAAEVRLGWMRRPLAATGYAGDVAAAEAMVEIPGLAAAVGPASSRATLLVTPIYAEKGIPLVSATATTRKLRGLSPWLFALAPDDEAEGAFMAGFLLDSLGARRITVFYLVADEYGLGLRDGLVQALRRRGVEPVDQVGILEDSDFPRRVDESLRAASPDAVVVAARTREAGAILRALGARLPRVPLVAADGATVNAAFLKAWRAAPRPAYAVVWWQADGDTASRRFAARVRQLTGVAATATDAMNYDALMVEAEAAREAGPYPGAIRRWLSELGSALPAYRGVTGPISFARGRPTNLIMTRVADTAPVPRVPR